MKKLKCILIFFLIVPVFTSCKNNSFRGTDCLVKLNNVAFTKSLNKAVTVTSQLPGDRLLMQSEAKTDFFNEPDETVKYSNAPVLLTKIDNTLAFTFTVKVTPEFDTTYDAGAIYIYSNDNLWHKFAFEMDERKLTRIVTVRTNTTSDDNNHDQIFEKYAFMKISSDTKSVGFYYSTDSITWQLVRVYRNNYPGRIWIGISSQSPIGKGIVATFEDCSLSKEPVKDFRSGI